MGILRTDKISGLETPTAVTGSVEFDGNDHLEIGSAGDFNFLHNALSDWTAECWVKSGDDSRQFVFGTGASSAQVGFSLAIMSTDDNQADGTGVFAMFGRGSSGNYRYWGSNNGLTLNTWHHVAAVFKSSDKTLTLYVDGREVDSGTGTENGTFGTGDYSTSNSSFPFVVAENQHSDTYLTGYVSNLRVVDGRRLYTSNFTPPVHELEPINGTRILCCNNPDSVTAFSNTGIGTVRTVATGGNPTVGTASTEFPGLTRDFTSGTEFKGVTTFDTQGYFVPPSGTTTDRDRTGGRLLWGGGHNPSPGKTTAIGYVTISSMGNSRDFGDLTLARRQLTGASSSTRGVFIGGDSSPTDASDDLMDYVTIASQGNAVFFGNLQAPGKQTPQGCSNGIRGISYGGGEPHTDQIDVFTIASLGDATDFGDAHVAGRGGAATESSTRALLAGGVGPADLNRIEYITMATNGDGQNFGDLLDGRRNIAGTSDGVRAVFAGGFTSPGGPSLNTLDYVTIATFGNSQDFGDLTVNRSNPGNGSSSNKIRGLIVGGNDSPAGSVSNSIDYITIATTGNAKDFGDAGSQDELTQTGLLTDSHGGIS